MTGSGNTSSLANRHCSPNAPPAAPTEIAEWHSQLPDWKLETARISREFKFKDFHQTMAFVNAVAWVAHCEDHHPDLVVGFGTCVLQFSTHSAGGLSLNDFISAAKVDRLFVP